MSVAHRLDGAASLYSRPPLSARLRARLRRLNCCATFAGAASDGRPNCAGLGGLWPHPNSASTMRLAVCSRRALPEIASVFVFVCVRSSKCVSEAQLLQVYCLHVCSSLVCDELLNSCSSWALSVAYRRGEH